ncbi:gamma-glutamylcyclotransferase [Halorhodospira sp. 9621]|uniref:gamma-glutamylcyclotransferase family protein n=1 Tax=Halorhodospira TaxID=85108 RepID=UPI001914CE3C|nr:MULTISPECIES: gamma-glutamylcyclotransferase family protein [Halorhodospira]MBK5935932.1 hypothetical protein [Halorhodospira halophila]MBK5943278.1 hypothetical protein [Halorhodospira halophila]MCG5526801.1 gamma-glutamylcyclotransferase [Halorhodospira halophila]MCG5533347.1 gamma-glutamylcyclotransferase [Halorhodospira sp. 9621]MCG5537816.1 gamma-glutamylcyclotransferase [Halorhodospira sp. 9622]
MQQRLFAYGTILAGADDPQVQAAIQRYTERIDEGWIRGRLYDLGPFPGAVPRLPQDSRETWVRGVLLTVLDPRRVFRVLDPYEDCDPQRPRAGLYRREQVAAHPASAPEAPLTCQIYWINRVPPYARLIDSGDWHHHVQSRPPYAPRGGAS